MYKIDIEKLDKDFLNVLKEEIDYFINDFITSNKYGEFLRLSDYCNKKLIHGSSDGYLDVINDYIKEKYTKCSIEIKIK